MKIHQLISDKIDVPVTNEEQGFIKKHDDNIKLTSLDEHDQWIAQGLVRKGFYDISKDNVTLVKKINDKHS
jgi:hypothetical protein